MAGSDDTGVVVSGGVVDEAANPNLKMLSLGLTGSLEPADVSEPKLKTGFVSPAGLASVVSLGFSSTGLEAVNLNKFVVVLVSVIDLSFRVEIVADFSLSAEVDDKGVEIVEDGLNKPVVLVC